MPSDTSRPPNIRKGIWKPKLPTIVDKCRSPVTQYTCLMRLFLLISVSKEIPMRSFFIVFSMFPRKIILKWQRFAIFSEFRYK